MSQLIPEELTPEPSRDDQVAKIELAKTSAELEKLSIENAQLRRSRWSDPALIASLLGLMISLFGNFWQHREALQADAQRYSEMQLANAKWQLEKEKLSREIERDKRVSADDATRRLLYNQELQQINNELSTFEKNRDYFQQQRRTEQIALDGIKLHGGKFEDSLEVETRIVNDYQESIKEIEQRHTELLQRRDHLESLLK